MNIYFAASIRGGRDDQAIYVDIIKLLSQYGTVLTEHVGKNSISTVGGSGKNTKTIFSQDVNWIKKADVLVAEVTQPSLGVGYEIARAEIMKKPILCLYRKNTERSLSAMIAGNSAVEVQYYKTPKEIKPLLEDFFRTNT